MTTDARRRISGVIAMSALAFAPAWAHAQNANQKAADAAPAATTAPAAANTTQAEAPAHLIGSHQIDRYDAIMKVRQELKSNPKNLADWIILGELAQEVATDVEPDRAEGYYRLARESFQNALKLAPNNESLKAAYAFAKDQEANAKQFAQTRKAATDSYLAARRQELANAETATPSIRTYNPPVANVAPGANAADVERDVDGNPIRYPYGSPYYQSVYGSNGRPYTYEEYTRSYFPPNYYGPNGPVENAPAPMTMRGYVNQFPNVLRNSATQGVNSIIRGAEVNPAAGAAPPAQP